MFSFCSSSNFTAFLYMYMRDKEHSSLFKNILLYNVDQSSLQETYHAFIPSLSRSSIR